MNPLRGRCVAVLKLWLCISINGRKIGAVKKIMYTNDESDLGSSDNNPPSIGGGHVFNLLILVT